MPKKLVAVLIIVVIAIAAVVGLTRSSGTDTSSPSGQAADVTEPNTVIIKNLDFATKKLVVKRGQLVTWKNQDTAKHTITFDDASLAAGNSQLIAPGASFTHTFDATGSFSYHCTPHPFMKATIVVTE